MSDITSTIGERIRIYRKKAGLTQERLAEKAGIHPTYVGQLERAEKNATLATIVKVANALDISLETLFEAISSGGTGNAIAMETYELISAQPEKDQPALLDMLKKNVEFKRI